MINYIWFDSFKERFRCKKVFEFFRERPSYSATTFKLNPWLWFWKAIKTNEKCFANCLKLNRSLFKNVLRSHKPLKYYVLLIRIVNNITYLFWWFFVQHYFIFRQIVILKTFWILFWKIIFERYLIEQAKCQLF